MTEEVTAARAAAGRPGVPEGAARQAAAAADAAAKASGVRIRELAELAGLRQACALFGDIWRGAPGGSPVTPELLRALAHSGSYVAGAFTGGELVGACVGFLAAPAGQAVHSHILGVTPRMRGRRVGFALKTHQRAWALTRGFTVVTWTFDPLVCRNAYFNVAVLAARPTRYLPDFYGAMSDDINGGDDTDRLLAAWPLTSGTVAAACQGETLRADAAALAAAGAQAALDIGPDGLPVTGRGCGAERRSGDVVLVRVPADIEALRRRDPTAAARWRRAARGVLGGLLGSGGEVTGFDRSGWYVVRRGGRPGRAAGE